MKDAVLEGRSTLDRILNVRLGWTMRPIFTLHAGEYLVGDYLEKTFKNCRVWLPSKDAGIDLLVTDKEHRKAVSLQVKFSKDFMRDNFKAIGWWTLKSDKIAKSLADLWVFAVYTFNDNNIHNVVIPPRRLLEILQALHGRRKLFQTYMCVSNKDRCWEARGLNKEDMERLATDGYENQERELTQYLDNWEPLQARLA
jgi:hypothetical protein